MGLFMAVTNLVELAVLLGISLLGFTDIEPANIQPLAPMGWGPFIPAMALIYISYVGFELISNASEELIDPARTVPRSILITLGISTTFYVLVVGVVMAVVNYLELGRSDVPFILLAERVLGMWGRWAGIIAPIMASLSEFSVTLGASARILFALGRDGHFPRFLAHLHSRHQTPDVALLLCAAIVIVFSASGIVKFVASLSDFGYLMGLGIINYAVIPLHRKMPNLRRPFETAWFPLIPILGVVTTWMFVPALEPRSFLLGGGLTALGMAIYLIRPDNRAEFARIPGAIGGWAAAAITRLKRKRMRVLIISGGRLAQNIANRLLAKDEYRMMFRSAEHQVTFVEDDEALCRKLEKRFNAPIFQGDGTKRDLLEQVGVENIDVVIAASEDDGSNVIAALQARQLGWDNVMAVTQEPEYAELLESSGVRSISAPWATAALVENLLDRPALAQLFEFGIGAAESRGGGQRDPRAQHLQGVRDRRDHPRQHVRRAPRRHDPAGGRPGDLHRAGRGGAQVVRPAGAPPVAGQHPAGAVAPPRGALAGGLTFALQHGSAAHLAAPPRLRARFLLHCTKKRPAEPRAATCRACSRAGSAAPAGP